MPDGILSYATYVPKHRLQRSEASGLLGGYPTPGTRSVASYDEDTTSLGVEAARRALRPGQPEPRILLFASSRPAYQDKTNAVAIHAALNLPSDASAYDIVGAVRSGTGAFRMALEQRSPSLAVLADMRGGMPGGIDELAGGDGASAFVCGSAQPEDAVIAELLGTGSATKEFLARWRAPGEGESRVWEERFGEQAYVPLAEHALSDAMKSADVDASRIDHLIVTGIHDRAARAVIKASGVSPSAVTADPAGVIGNTGTAHFGIMLASVLAVAAPGQTIAVVVIADGADAFVFRATDALPGFQLKAAAAPAAQTSTVDYVRFLTWRGQLHREPPRRPEPDSPAAPPAARNASWKFGFVGSRCNQCSRAHLPPHRVCSGCRAVDDMHPEGFAGKAGTIVTFTIDHLAYSMSPPSIVAVIDFDGGGRFSCQLTDCEPVDVRIGGRVEMTFRRLYEAGGVMNYFWKARPTMELTA